MSFFEHIKPKPEDPNLNNTNTENVNFKNIHPSQIIIDGSNLIKVIEDKKDLPEGKIDIQTMLGWQPFNYNPETGEMK